MAGGAEESVIAVRDGVVVQVCRTGIATPPLCPWEKEYGSERRPERKNCVHFLITSLLAYKVLLAVAVQNAPSVTERNVLVPGRVGPACTRALPVDVL